MDSFRGFLRQGEVTSEIGVGVGVGVGVGIGVDVGVGVGVGIGIGVGPQKYFLILSSITSTPMPTCVNDNLGD